MTHPRTRRYRARGPRARPDQSLEALRALNRAAAPQAASIPADPLVRPGERDRQPGRRRPADSPARGRRRPWSARGLGPWGWAWRIATLLIVAVVLWGGLGFMAIQNATDAANRQMTRAGRVALTPAAGSLLTTPQNTLIVGTDVDPGEVNARADGMMIMRTDPNSGRIG